MTIAFPKNRKNGNVILIVICIILALLAFLASFLKSTTSRIHTTKKLNDTIMAREFASSLANLCNHYIRIKELNPDSDSDLKKFLSVPLNKMASKKASDITKPFTTFIKEKIRNNTEDILTLLEKQSGLEKLKWTLSWSICKEDFLPINVGISKIAPYPREKTGFIRFEITISHLAPGSKSSIKEDYVFLSPVKVVANILPVLSKFSFYIENALDGEEANKDNTFRFNVVDTKASGDLKNGGSIRPWVINNGENTSDAKNSYDDLVNDSRGLVYIGGGSKDFPIQLGIARGWADSGFGKYGEDFHFFKNEKPKAGYWKTLEMWNESERIGIMTSNIGLCNDISDDNLSAWQDQLGKYEEQSKYHSIFKLYGTDGRKSPTMVLGYVDSVCDSIRILKNGSSGVVFLGNIKTEAEFLCGLGYEIDGMPGYSSGYETEKIVKAYQNAFGTELQYEEYNEKIASRLISERYNNDYTYILTNNMVDYPISRGGVSDKKLKELCGNYKDSNIFCEVPYSKMARYNDIFGNDLTKLDVFLDKEKLFIDGSENTTNNTRLIGSTKIKNQNDFISYMTSNGYLSKNTLDLNGFIYLDCDGDIELTLDKCQVKSHGGIILSQGNLLIKGDINSSSGAHLTLLALKGDITVEKNVQNIDASLIAGEGQVKLIGDARDSELTVNGNIVMKSVKRGNINTDESIRLKRGLNLNYNNALSAIPAFDDGNIEEEHSELPLLMYGLTNNIKMLD
jgi:hypothetical protein